MNTTSSLETNFQATQSLPDETDRRHSMARGGLDPAHRGAPALFHYLHLEVEGSLEEERLLESFRRSAGRHRELIGGLVPPGAGPRSSTRWQRIMTCRDLRDVPRDAVENAARAAAEEWLQRPLDRTGESPFEMCLLRLGDRRQVLLCRLHCIAGDERSLAQVVRELFAGEPPEVGDAAGIEEQLENPAHRRYWREQLRGVSPVFELPADLPRRPHPGLDFHKVRVDVSADLSRRLREVATVNRATLEDVVLAGFGMVLSRCSGRKEFLVGAPFDRRPSGSGTSCGAWTRELPLRLRISSSTSPRSLVAALRYTREKAAANAEVDFVTLAEDCQAPEDPSRRQLVQARFRSHRSLPRSFEGPDGQGKVVEWGSAAAASDVELHLGASTGDGLALCCLARRDLFHETTARRFLDQLGRCLERFADEPSEPLGPFDLAAPAQRHQMHLEWQGSPPLSGAPLLHEAFEEWARLTPAAIAVEDEKHRLTYRRLEERSRALAHQLRNLGAGPETVVGLLMDRSVESAVGMLAILRSGAAYLPLDPGYPRQRLALMLSDAGAPGVVTVGSLAHRIPSESLWVETSESWQEASSRDLPGLARPENLAYIIYTSGSTGRPKGVAVTHGSASRLLRWMGEILPRRDLARVLASTSFSFDISVFETLVTWGLGGTAVLVPDVLEMHSVDEITAVNTVPSAMVAALRNGPPAPTVGTIILAGEALPASLATAVHEAAPQARLLNLYGPTEDTVFSTAARISSRDSSAPPIGRPISGSQAFLGQPTEGPLPQGIPGELLLAGEGLARGYLGRPALTAERFVPNPNGSSGSRLYRTGDLARHRPDGNLEYLGRIDHQVKVRGFRIEPGEIVAAMTGLPGVEEASVVIRGAGEAAQVAAYYVSRSGEPLEGLAGTLRKTLPGYLVPSTFTVLASMPRTANGKLDRGALPDPAKPLADGGKNEPRTLLEDQLAAIWTEVLEVGAIGPEANFFDHGGNSLQANRVLAKVREIFEVDLPRGSLFETSSLRGLASRIRGSHREGHRRPPLVAGPASPRQELSPQQLQLWLFEQSHPKSPVYNILEGFELEGRLDIHRLAGALETLVDRHEVLRTALREDEEGAFGAVSGGSAFPLPVVDLSALPAALRSVVRERLEATEGRRRISLAAPPLLRCTLIRSSPDSHTLLLTVHHGAADGWSMSVLHGELSELYSGGEAGERGLAPLCLRYEDFTRWQKSWLSGDGETELVSFWRHELADLEPLHLPTDRPRPRRMTLRGDRLEIPSLLAPEALKGLRRVAARTGSSLFQVALTAFQFLLSRWAGQGDVAVGVPAAQRDAPELESLVGYLVNILVLRTQIPTRGTFEELLIENQRRCARALNHQDLPFERLAATAGIQHSPDRNPIFQGMFQLLQGSHRLALEGLRVEPRQRSNGTAKFDLELCLEDEGTELRGYLEYATDLFDRTTLIRFLGHFQTLLGQISRSPGSLLASFEGLSAAERHRLKVEAVDSHRLYPGPLLLHALVEAQARRAPRAVAVLAEDRSLSYGELEKEGNQLARYLRSLGVAPDHRVGVLLERDSRLPVAVLGVLKAGAGVLPLDPKYPKARLLAMVAQGEPSVVICSRESSALARELGVEALVLEEASGRIAEESFEALLLPLDPSTLAYVLFTSGSTGRPKGVAMAHEPLVNLIRWQGEEATPGGAPKTLQFASLNFDVSFQEIFSTWASGGTLCLAGETLRQDPNLLLGFLDREGVERIFVPFVTLQALAESGADRPWPGSLREVITAGEQPRLGGAVGRWLRRQEGVRLHNQYGPTEAHVTTAWISAGTLAGAPEIAPAGRSIANHRAYVVDRFSSLAGLGVAGELLIGGVGLARGYLGRPARTALSFVPDPFSEVPGGRLYRTGDRMRRLSGGDLEFLGRLDDQVKVRGFRVELREVEGVLESHPSLSKVAAVIDRKGAPGGRLLAYGVPAAGIAAEEVDVAQLKSFVASKLPGYMVPSVIVPLPALPKTPSGKLDYRALPVPKASSPRTRRREPLQALEESVLAIWGELFDLEPADIDLEDDFFALGGHSLLAMRLASRLRESLAAPCSVGLVLENPTPGSQARCLEDLAPVSQEPIARCEDAIPQLSLSQERFLDLHALDPESGAYIVCDAFRFEGEPSLVHLREALEGLVRRHEVLRMRFSRRGSRWRPHPDCPVEELLLVVVDLGAIAAADREAESRRLLRRAAAWPFDAATPAPKLRAWVLRQAPVSWDLVLTAPHFAVDGGSLNLLVGELETLYAAARNPALEALPELPIRYRDFAAWERRQRATARALDLDYWRERLSGVSSPVLLPPDRPRGGRPSAAGAYCRLALGRALSERSRAFADRLGITLFVLILGAFGELLRRLSGQRDRVVGVPVEGRRRRELENLVGCFVNVLPMRIRGSGEERGEELLLRLRKGVHADLGHSELSLDELMSAGKGSRPGEGGSLYETLFQVLDTGSRSFRLEGVEGRPLKAAYECSGVDTEWILEDSPSGLEVHVIYRSSLFDASTVQRWTHALGGLLASLCRAPQCPVGDLETWSKAERHQFLCEWNDTARDFGRDCSLPELLRWAPRHRPDAVALVFGDESLSHRQLDRRANRLAHYLLSRGVGPDSRVGVALERSLDLVVSLLAILKAGGAYVPLEPTLPSRRRDDLVRDAALSLVIAHRRPREVSEPEEGEASPVPWTGLEEEWPAIRRCSPKSPGIVVHPLSSAYAIYTSGSTGRPKGVVNSHRGIVNRLRWMQAAYRLGPEDRVLQKTPFSFDVSVWEFFWPLMVGARLVLAKPEGHKDPQYLLEIMRREEITTVHFVPSMLQIFLDVEVASATSLKRVIVSGEALSAEVERRFLEVCGAQLHNLYGPTEAAVDVTAWPCRRGSSRASVPIGRPIANMGLRVVDRRGRLCPQRVAGELLLTGPGLARGYLGRPGLTARSFVPDGFARAPGERAYRTGDLVRWAPDGVIEFIGRIDSQVKIRGFRVELKEVELALEEHPSLAKAAAMVERPGTPEARLLAYGLPAAGIEAGDVDISALREFLAAKLPGYMVPSAITLLEEFPSTVSGKLDYRALPAPSAPSSSRGPRRGPHRSPRSAMEELVLQVWAELFALAPDDIDLQEDFFSLGGHSLLAMRLASRLGEKLGVACSVAEVLENPSPASLARCLEGQPPEERDPIPRSEEAVAPLSLSQERFLDLHALDPGSGAYVVSDAFRFDGEPSLPRLAEALKALTERHEVLLTRFSRAGSQHRPHCDCLLEELSLTVVDLGNLSPSAGEDQSRLLLGRAAGQPFEAESRTPKIRAWVLRRGSDSWDLVLTFPHFAVDGGSFEILRRELGALYAAAGKKARENLGEAPIRYRDFAVWERETRAAAQARDLDYWQERLAGVSSPVLLPPDRPRGGWPSADGAYHRLPLGRSLSEGAHRLARDQGVTLFMVVLGAFGELLRRLSGQRDLVLGVPLAGRHRPELEDLVGCLVSVVPMRLRLSRKQTGAQLLTELRKGVLADLGHGEVPLDELTERVLGKNRGKSGSLYQTLFQVAGTGSRTLRLDGVEGRPLTAAYDSCRVDTEWVVQDASGGMEVHVLYRDALFDSSTMGRWTAALGHLLASLCRSPEVPLGELEGWSKAQRQQVLFEWNDTEADYGPHQSLHGALHSAARRWPKEVAVVFEDEVLSYRRLDHRANRLARHLQDLGVRPESLVGVALERSPDLMITLLAILKAGGVYLPLDPTLPAKRLDYMVENSGLEVVVTHGRFRQLFEVSEGGRPPVTVVELEASRKAIDRHPSSDPGVAVHPSSAAYAIYTSGSTGQPKGVVNSHRGIVNRLRWMQDQYRLGPEDRILQKTPFSFDVSVWEFFWPLMVGARLVFARPEGHKDPLYLLETIRREGITTVHFVPSMLQMFLGVKIESAESLRRVIVSGEALPLDLERRFLQRSSARLHNLYGPTEAAVDVTAWPCRRDSSRLSVPIGRPIANMGLRVVDRRGRLCPQGIGGELLLVGPGLARGYLRRPALTAQSFIPDGSSRTPGARAYRTGDLVRWATDGTLEFLGRVDHQVKIRGFRIEIGEIEVRLAEHAQVTEAVVTDWLPDSGDRRLVAYLVATSNPSVSSLREFLGRNLPDYMIPAHFVFLDELPLNPNGKVDRKKLPEPQNAGLQRDRKVVAPRTPTEEGLVEIWQDLMEVEEISVLDDFFDLGGHSLLAIHLVTHIRDRWGVDLPVATLFGASTLEGLAAVVDDSSLIASAILLPMGGQDLRGPPFFCIHGIGGNLFRLVKLARLVARHRGFYGLQGWAKLDDTSYLSSVDSMAERYLAEIDTVQPEGPLFLGGYSLGSMVAYEMARRARERGREVAFVALLDVEAPAEGASVEAAAETLEGESFEGGIAMELGISISIDAMTQMTPQERLAYVLEEGKKSGALPSGFGVADAFRFIDVYQKTALASYSYGPRPYRGSVTLFATPAEDGDDPTRGWRDLVSGGVEVVPIEGSHFTMVQPPAVTCLADALVAAMDRARGRLVTETSSSRQKESRS